jgi:hemerythrin superfamily protein
MNPSNLIKQDHRTVKTLFRKFERAKTSSEKQRIGQEIIEELSIHAIIEEQLVYPVIRADKRMEESVLNALEEHGVVKHVLAELDKMNVDDERYDAKMHVVTESVEMHIEEEEGELLPRLDKLLASAEKAELARKIVELKQMAPNLPHPAAPDTPPGRPRGGIGGEDYRHREEHRARRDERRQGAWPPPCSQPREDRCHEAPAHRKKSSRAICGPRLRSAGADVRGSRAVHVGQISRPNPTQLRIPAARFKSNARSRSFFVSVAARSSSARASSLRPRRERKSARTAGTR